MGVCSELKLPLWYGMPCLAEHVPYLSAFGTPTAFAPDFDPDFQLELRPGFQPPEDVPGWLTLPEGATRGDTPVASFGIFQHFRVGTGWAVLPVRDQCDSIVTEA